MARSPDFTAAENQAGNTFPPVQQVTVRDVQQALVAAGYHIAVDGIDGPQTQAAYQAYASGIPPALSGFAPASAPSAPAAIPSPVDNSAQLMQQMQAESQSQNDALQRAIDAQNQQVTQQLQMQRDAQIADLQAKMAGAQQTQDSSVATLQPQLGDLQSQHDLTQANFLQGQAIKDAQNNNNMYARGLGESGVQLGAEGRFQSAQNQAVGAQDLQLHQQQDAITRAIQQAQQTGAASRAQYQTQIGALQNSV